jgi:hypothetical protein
VRTITFSSNTRDDNLVQAFLAPLPGKVVRLFKKEYWYHLYHTGVIEETIYLYSNRLTLGLSTCVSYAGWCMTSFDLLTNYLDHLEVLLRKAKASLKKVLTLESKDNWIRSLTQEFEAMANKTLHEFFAPTTTNIRTRPSTNVRENGFELKSAVNMVQASQFYGKAHEDVSAYLQHFLKICSTFTILGGNQRCYSTSPFPIFTIGNGKTVVLC